MDEHSSLQSVSLNLVWAQRQQSWRQEAVDASGWPEPLIALAASIRSCSACPDLHGVPRVFSTRNGPSHARCIIVAEAPGRFGASRSMIPLYGDVTGKNFDFLLESAGLSRSELFITNAVLCNPLSPQGTNRSPRMQEVATCSSHLTSTLALIGAPVVVTLGGIALRALSLIAPHPYKLRSHVGQVLPWHGRLLIPLYHPGPRARIHRPVAQQIYDFKTLAQLLKTLDESGGRGKGRKDAPQVGDVAFDLCMTG